LWSSARWLDGYCSEDDGLVVAVKVRSFCFLQSPIVWQPQGTYRKLNEPSLLSIRETTVPSVQFIHPEPSPAAAVPSSASKLSI